MGRSQNRKKMVCTAQLLLLASQNVLCNVLGHHVPCCTPQTSSPRRAPQINSSCDHQAAQTLLSRRGVRLQGKSCAAESISLNLWGMQENGQSRSPEHIGILALEVHFPATYVRPCTSC